MTYKILIVVRSGVGGAHSHVVEFDTEAEALVACRRAEEIPLVEAVPLFETEDS